MASTSLPHETAAEARAHLDLLDGELRQQTPDRPTIADRVKRLADLLVRTGTLASAGASLVTSLQILAAWLGHLGQPITTLLHAVT